VIVFVIVVAVVVGTVFALALVSGARYTPPRRETAPPILRVTTRSQLDGGSH
jgi:hypothetical protein